MRLHHILFWRLVNAKKLASPDKQFNYAQYMKKFDDEVDIDAENSKANQPLYNVFLSNLYALIDGSIDNNRFEELCRQTLGNKSFFTFTLDKVVHQLVKCMQSMANDENVNKLIGLFIYHRNRPNGCDPVLYQLHVANMLSHTLEDVYRMQLLCSSPNAIDGNSVVACQVLGMLHSIAPNEECTPQVVLPDADEDDNDPNKEDDNAMSLDDNNINQVRFLITI